MPAQVAAHSVLLSQLIQHLSQDAQIIALLGPDGQVWPTLTTPTTNMDVAPKPFLYVHEGPFFPSSCTQDFYVECHASLDQGHFTIRQLAERVEWLVDYAPWAPPTLTLRRPGTSRVISVIGPVNDRRWPTRKYVVYLQVHTA